MTPWSFGALVDMADWNRLKTQGIAITSENPLYNEFFQHVDAYRTYREQNEHDKMRDEQAEIIRIWGARGKALTAFHPPLMGVDSGFQEWVDWNDGQGNASTVDRSVEVSSIFLATPGYILIRGMPYYLVP